MTDEQNQSARSESAEPDSKPKHATQAKVRRRNRMITSCLECRRRKLKCDKQNPCTNCNKFSRECTFLAPALDSVSQQRLNEIKEKMGSLERVLEEDVAKRSHGPGRIKKERKSSIDLPGEDGDSGSDTPPAEYEKGIEPTPLAVVDASYEDDADDDVLDLGVRIGKMRMGERLGGFVRPKFSEELTLALANPQYDRRTDEERQFGGIPPLADNSHDFLEPGPTFANPGSGFVFGDVGGRHSLIDFLPTKDVADGLVSKYYENVHLVCRVLHSPSFQFLYDNFWTTVLAGYEPQASGQAVVLAVMFSAVASMPETDVTAIFGRPKKMVQANFQKGAEVSLSKAQFLRTTKMETLQALVIYLIPMCRDQISRAHSVLVGTAIRLGECMGLHRDPKDVYSFPPVECHTRRILWFQLLYLDFRTGESHGPRPCVKREDFDTRFPLNIDDADLMSGKIEETNTRFTDMTLSRLRFECNEMQRIIWYDRIRLEKKTVSLTHVLGKIESFRKAMMAKYEAMLDRSVPVQRYASIVLQILLNRMHIMVLHRYLNHMTKSLPDRLRQVVLTTGIAQLEGGVELEKDPELSRWKWYNMAHHQWHAAFLLMFEVYQYPHRKEADRIWKVADFVFEPDLSLSRTQKGRSIIAAVRDRGAVYRDIRRMRAPGNMRSSTVREIWDIKPCSKPSEADQEMQQHAPSNPLLQQSYPSPDVRSPSEAINQSAMNTDWSFNNMATSFFTKGRSSSAEARVLQQQQSFDAMPNRAPSVPGLEYSSPSENSTNDPANWPPLISADQRGWVPMQAMTSPANPNMQVPATAGFPIPPTAGFQPQSFFAQTIPQRGALGGTPSSSGGEEAMPDIDWSEWDKIFPPEHNNGHLDITPPQFVGGGGR
ncbi:uncharacterized protein HMPREF1541_05902 [Cyphellophora europaea CBS 101466]|uniref:Zn(2)-C6 fungal-type domain-containing protein n=1 Tax=Cyphellophora europaea (strain CBS 101466) TaxID=1220924 RepID=W2RT29_CYPE1|nr:uncharacterized protein HMPREF1541_05902 [Cyphellophora europaea CBS 101466]ETN39676.1 hypothetical protein HMPREF1541_05902 [Cyphellophora europaea CBS 101466]